eukprot:TRINITY_DN23550_c0_g1_i1.p1 TRINITY_DN23550_c0_g1~~TRINITY_DN23550_c0_g1_i1.p1  ORF type:complete len:175 (+),score=49.02 TRINITY_DN23550_c0_g1_i1:72-596(+)
MGLAPSWTLVGMAVLCGMLIVDCIFDLVAQEEAMHSYYCALLPTLFRAPDNLRVVLPVGFVALSVLRDLYRSGCRWHWLTCGALILGGGPSFAVAVVAVQNMCEENVTSSTASNALKTSHGIMALTFAVAMFAEAKAAAAANVPAPLSQGAAGLAQNQKNIKEILERIKREKAS